MSINNYELLLFFFFLRIILSIIVLYYFKFNIFFKLFLIIFLDYIDNGCLLFENLNKCVIDFYQKYDKITDIICYGIILFYIIQYKCLSNNYINLIIFLFFFRLLGTIIYLLKDDRSYLFLFPNFFLEILLFLLVMKNFTILKKNKFIIIIIIIIVKFLQEYIMHYTKCQNIPCLLNNIKF